VLGLETEWTTYVDDFLVDVEEFSELKISKISAHIGKAKYLEKFVIATGSFEESRNLILFVNLGDHIGVGEAPLGEISKEEIIRELDVFRSNFLGKTFKDYIEFLKKSKLVNWLGLSIEMAMLDAIAKAKGVRYGDLFAGAYYNTVETDVTIGIRDLEETVKAFEKFVSMGFRKIKIKVGLNLKEDIERIKALFDIAPSHVSFRIDANQGYTNSEAIEFLEFLERESRNIEFLEQPLKKDELEAIGRLRKITDIPIIVDESVRLKEDVEKVSKYVDGVNLKPIKSGGILELAYSFRLAKDLALLTMIGCSSESNIGITSSTYIASTHSIDFADLDSDILQEPLTKKQITSLKGGFRILPSDPGLGISPNDINESNIENIY